MWKRVLLIQFIASLFAAMLPTTGHASATKTVEIVAVAICKDDSTTCGYNSVDELRQLLRHQLFWTNEVFRPTGISFRLNEVHVVKDKDHYSFPGCGTTAEYRANLATEWGGDDPDRLYWFAFQESTGGCCAVFPWAGGATNAVFCRMTAGRSNIAHEYGHSFCQAHTFREVGLSTGGSTKWDPVNGTGDHNGDGLADTPLDPCGLEVGTNPEDHDSDGNMLFALHDWCTVNEFTSVDPGSVGPSWATLDCTHMDYDGNPGVLELDGNITSNIMSYWPGRGPFTVMGVRTEGFSPLQRQGIASCLVDYPEQRGYTNVCPEGDFDHDGWCNSEDKCPGVYNFSPDDTDEDGIGDECDNCIENPNSDQSDIDDDKVGDACDPDSDGDGCCDPDKPGCPPEQADQHPSDNQVPVGTIVYVGCPEGNETGVLYGPEGQHSDNDGILDCADDDDDGDGVKDWNDPCPTVPGIDPKLCTEPRPCNKPWPEYCAPFCGNGLFAKLLSVVNPDPTREMVWDHIAVFNNVLHLGTSFGTSFSEQMGAFLGGSFQAGGAGARAAGDRRDLLELQLWSGNPTGKASFVKVLARFEALTPDMLGDPRFGRTLVVEQSPDGATAVSPTWLLGMPPNAKLPDADGDGVPDVADDCLKVPNPFQADRDHDGYGDDCDADFNQDGVVDLREVLLVRDCLGVDLTWTCGFEGENYPDDYPPCDSAKAEAVVRCQDRDLDGDRHIDADDVALAMALLDHPPGPSGLVDITVTNKLPVAVCKDVTVATQSGLCTADASVDGGSFDPDGDPITLVQSPAGPYPLGNTSVTLTVTDPSGASASCSATVTVVDREAPVIGAVSASPNVLWPPNHQMVAVAVTANATDNCGTAPACRIVSVMSNEPINGTGDGDTAPDWEIVDANHVRLRAERAGIGNERIYTITVMCTDVVGNSLSENVSVNVPHDRNKK